MIVGGRSLHRYEGRWHEHDLEDTVGTDQSLTFSLDVEDGDRITVAATSIDGHRYLGEYRYREGGCSNGEVLFDRYRGPAGEVFVGEWLEAGGAHGPWVVLLEAKSA